MKKVLLLMCMLFVLAGCTKGEKKDAVLRDNEYNLTAADGKSIKVTLPNDFACEQNNENVSVLKAYYQKSSTKPLNIYYFKESDDYSVKDIEKKMHKFVKEYRELAQINQGKILDSSEMCDIKTGKMSGKYVEVTYILDGSESYCGEFYLQHDGYVMRGTVRLDCEDVENMQISKLVQQLLS